jgi:amino acid adenylation domain-containing protein
MAPDLDQLTSRILAFDPERRRLLFQRLAETAEVEPEAAQPQLSAFIVAEPGARIEAAEVLDFLRQRLPDACIPRRYEVLDELPRIGNGKVDRRRLAELAPGSAAAEPELRRPPHTPVQELVATLWSALLNRDTISLDSDFFLLGGHSLLAARLMSRLQDVLDVAIPTRRLFERPVLSDFCAAVEEERRARRGFSPPPITSNPDAVRGPLSFSQERLWFIEQLDGGAGAYNSVSALKLTGDLDEAALEQAFGALIDRHGVLRAGFEIDMGRPTQVIHAAAPFALTVTDLGDQPAETQDAAVVAEARAEGSRPFDLSAPPLLRARLFRLGPDRHALVVAVHHIVSDGWSGSVMMNELTAFYNAARGGQPHDLPPLPLQYLDFSAWQRGWVSEAMVARQLAYWQERLADMAPLLDLPTDFDRPAVATFKGRAEPVSIPAELVARLKQLSRTQGVSLFMLLLGAFSVLLYRYSGQRDIIVGTDTAGRNHTVLEPLIGLFVDQLVLRTEIDGQRAFKDLLKQVRATTLDAYDHQDTPFARLVEALGLERDLGYNPLYQVSFTLHDAPPGALALDGLRTDAIAIDTGVARFDLELNLAETDRGLEGALICSDLFAQTTARNLVAQFLQLLEAVVDQPDASIDALTLLSPHERQRVLVDWNQTEVAFPQGGLLTRLEAHARQTPDAPAALDDQGRLTYRELHGEVATLAAALRAEGVGRGDLVALLAPRSTKFLVAVLACFEAGAAYLPLDPLDPPARRQQLVADSRAKAVIAEVGLDPPTQDHGGALRLDLDDLLAWDGPLAAGVTPGSHDLAYVIYTSGSTGAPKGAMVEHAGMVNHLWAKVRDLDLGPADIIAQTASQCFDISVWQFLCPLMVGAQVRIYPDDIARDPFRLLERVRGDAVTVWETVPSLLRSLLSIIDDGSTAPPDLPALRWLVVTGEALAPELCRHWLALYPHIPIVNAYGPTECSDDVTHAVFRESPADLVRNLPIGRPIANTQLYLLDALGEPAPVGATGHLHIGGVGVGRGYLGAPGRTAETFLPDPFATTPGRRMYRSGDLARFQPDGVIEFLGRADHQVKLRGFRIELGEIENVLTEHPWVRDAVAVVHRGDAGDEGLTAYVVLDDAGSGSSAPGGGQSERLRDWQAVFDDMYEHAKTWSDALYAGWASSYTGSAIPDAEMAHWRFSTVERIRALRPRRVLEVGCGLGMLLSELAPDCERFCGVDFSQQALDDLRARLDAETPAAAHATLLNRRADDLTNLPDGPFDTIVLNSVAQYFPNLEYLLTVLDGMFENLAEGGRIFLGDLRNLPLADALHAHVSLAQAGADVDLGVLRERIRRAAAEEGELMLHPAFFQALRARHPRIAAVEIQLKRGDHQNELTRFRYDVILRTDPGCADQDAPLVIDWRGPADLETARASLAPGRTILVRGVPNARLAEPIAVLRHLEAAAPDATVGDLRAEIAAASLGAIEPEVFWDLESPSHHVAVLWSRAAGTDGCFDVLIEPRAPAVEACQTPRRPEPAAQRTPHFWRQFANNPMQEKFALHIEPRIKAFLATRLPAHMAPSAFMMLAELPLNRNGKLDRKALPAPERRRSETSGYLEPRTPTEQAIAAIWSDLLGEPLVGRSDNFFEIGGHSLIAVQVLARIRKQFGVDLTIRAFFEHKTVEGLAHEVDQRRTSDGAEVSGPAGPVLRALEPRNEYDLAAYQLPEWYIHELDPDTPAYNICWNLLFSGDFQPQLFMQACQAFVRRHRVMASTFHTVDGAPVVRVPAEPPPTLDAIIDSTHVGDAQFHAYVQRLATEISATAPDFADGPLFRMRLHRFSGGRFVFLFMVHHIIWDETSTMVMVRELRELYAALVEGRAPALPPVDLTYFDYAQWTNARIASGDLERERQYWADKLRRPPPPLALPTDRPRPPVQTFLGDELRVDLSPALSDRAATFAKDHGVTPYILFLALLNAHLHAWSGQRDFVVGSPSANRHDERLKGMIGLFATALPLRCAIRDGMTFAQLLDETRETVIAALENQAYPSVLAIQDLAPEMDPSRNRVFSIMYGLQNDKTGLLREERFGRASVTSVRDIVTADAKAAPCDLTFIVDHHLENLFVRINYNSDLFDGATIEAMADDLLRLVERAIAAPDLRLADIEGAGRDRARAFSLHVGPRLAFDAAVPLHRRVLDQAARTPDAVALRDEDGTVSYADLAAASHAWAAAVRAAGVAREERVGLQMSSGVPLAAAALGVMAAGGAFVALSPDAPCERLRRIAADAGVRLVLTDGEAVTVAPERIDAGDLAAVDGPVLDDAAAHPSGLAYVAYTSGSTGAPKGVQIEHRGLGNLLTFTQDRYGLSPGDRVLWLTPLSFDASILEVFWPLSVGAQVVVCPEALRRDPPRLLAFAAAQGVTVLQGVPTLIEALADSIARGEAASWPQLRLVICGGAALPQEAVGRIRQRLGGRLVNHYGPTEVTVDASCHDCADADADADATSPIGRPIANARLVLLDDDLRLVAPGAVGEIWAASPGLARGYLNAPGQTASRFLPNPFADVPGDRLYRTGDLGCADAAGILHFRGRVDDQVQVHGNRVELGDIQHHLERHPDLACAAVLATAAGDEDQPGLIAFVSPKPAVGAIDVDGRPFWLFTLGQRPDLADATRALHDRSWPSFFAGSDTLLEYWARLAVELPDYQCVLCSDDDDLLAVGNAAPIRWDGTLEDLPRGWDDGLARAFRQREAAEAADTLFILAAAADRPAMSQAILSAFRHLAHVQGLSRIIVAVRPVAERADMDEPFETWALTRRPDDLLQDRWLRAHERAGGRVLRIDPRSQFVQGDLASWAEWIGKPFDRPGENPGVPGTLQPVLVDLEHGRATYWDPAVWMQHRPLRADEAHWRPVNDASLRAWLLENLPPFMVPESFVVRPRLQQTEAGKVDRAVLRQAPEVAAARRRGPTPPRTAIQQQLADIWREVLQADGVGMEDNFFRLGGNSMKAVRLIAEIRRILGADLSLREALRRPTILGLEQLILSDRSGVEPSPPPSPSPVTAELGA